jgi:dihydroorotate dehydrogenase
LAGDIYVNIYQGLVFPVLKRFDAEGVHDRTIQLLEFAQQASIGRRLLRSIRGSIPRRKVDLFNLSFANEIGVAAGFDKDVRVVEGLALLGFGHVEVGTLTPYAQRGNPRPRIFRLVDDKAIINRMGFPNCGVAEASERLRLFSKLRQSCIIGVSLGKQKETPLDEAWRDYVIVMAAVYDSVDYFTVNISSPNTPGLRKLQGRRHLPSLLNKLSTANKEIAAKNEIRPRPLLIKIAPDLDWQELDSILDIALDQSIDGIVATNTTLKRQGIVSLSTKEAGGLSGKPLKENSTEIVKYIRTRSEEKLPIIAAGGIFNVDDVLEKLDAGASLVQIYTGLIYEGPGIAGKIVREL